MVAGSNLSWQGIKRKAVYTEWAGLVCTCMGSVHWKGVHWVGDRDLGVQNFINWFLKLTNQKRPKVTWLVRYLD